MALHGDGVLAEQLCYYGRQGRMLKSRKKARVDGWLACSISRVVQCEESRTCGGR